MPGNKPRITNGKGTRTFDCFPAALLVFVVNDEGRILLLSHPRANGRWEVVNGAMDRGDTVLGGAVRELREEAGESLRARPLGIVHTYTHRYDEAVGDMISICYLFAYEGGKVIPGDDMTGSAVRWASPDEIESGEVEVFVPRQTWVYRRAVELHRAWRDEVHRLEKEQGQHGGYKYDKGGMERR